MLDAKQAIMEEHHRQFQTLCREGQWEEALHEIRITLSCAADLLDESLRVLDQTLEPYNLSSTESSAPPPTSMQ
jgi:hypothetical protein